MLKMKIVSEVWHIAGDEEGLTFLFKIDAEAYARELFPDEDESRRYARIGYREVWSYVYEDEGPFEKWVNTKE